MFCRGRAYDEVARGEARQVDAAQEIILGEDDYLNDEGLELAYGTPDRNAEDAINPDEEGGYRRANAYLGHVEEEEEEDLDDSSLDNSDDENHARTRGRYNR